MTVKELATELKLSKTGVMNLIRDLELNDKLVKVGNRYEIPDTVADTIRAAVEEKKSPTDSSSDIIRLLQEQLQAKDRQIEKLQDENKELVRAIQQQNHLLLTATQEAQNAEDLTEETTVTVEDQEQPEQKKGFFRRLFGW